MACICCPYGPWVTFPGVFAVLAFVFTLTFTFDCEFFTAAQVRLSPEDPAGISNGTSFGYGLWFIQDLAGIQRYSSGEYQLTTFCATYNQRGLVVDEVMDTPLRFARVISMITSCLSVPAFAACYFPACLLFDDNGIFFATGGLCIFLGILSILSMVAMASSLCTDSHTGCSLGRSGIFCIVASIFWFLTAILLFFIPKEPRDDIPIPSTSFVSNAKRVPQQQQQQLPPPPQIVIERTNNPDGTVTVVTTSTVTNPDGTQTITKEEAVEHPALPAPTE